MYFLFFVKFFVLIFVGFCLMRAVVLVHCVTLLIFDPFCFPDVDVESSVSLKVTKPKVTAGRNTSTSVLMGLMMVGWGFFCVFGGGGFI